MNIKLSEAIRLGSMLKPQGFGDKSANPEQEATCALGASLSAIGASVRDVTKYDFLRQRWPFLCERKQCPACGFNRAALWIISDHLNDRHKWTRERIADWVATIEPEDTQQLADTLAENERLLIDVGLKR